MTGNFIQCHESSHLINLSLITSIEISEDKKTLLIHMKSISTINIKDDEEKVKESFKKLLKTCKDNDMIMVEITDNLYIRYDSIATIFVDHDHLSFNILTENNKLHKYFYDSIEGCQSRVESFLELSRDI